MRDHDFDDDDNPFTAEEAQDRLQAPCLLANHEIPCMIFGEDALCLVFLVPTMVFSLNLIVADRNVNQAVHIITTTLPYVVNTNKLIRNFNNPLEVDPDQTRAYPRSVFLSCVDPSYITRPAQIIVHPETEFNLDIRNPTRSTAVDMFPGVVFPANVRLPTKGAMVDSVIDTTLDPNNGLLIEPVLLQLRIWLAYIIGYGIRVQEKVLANGDLDYRTQALVDLVKEENRPYLLALIRREKGRADDREHCKRRRDIIRANGYSQGPVLETVTTP